MKTLQICVLTAVLAGSSPASWYWPFGSSDSDDEPPRISELMEPASLLIDEASDLAAEGKVDEAIGKYRKALETLDRIEVENPDRADKPEFATLRNKRAYVNASIDSLLLAQIKSNAKAVAVSDTTALEKRLEEERKAKKAEKTDKKTEKAAPAAVPTPATTPAPAAAQQQTKREQAMAAVAKDDFETAGRLIGEMLAEKPNSAAALNIKAAMEARQGKFKEAERTLDQAIGTNPRNHFAYYNMARLLLQTAPDDKTAARRFYESGRAFGGPADSGLEEALR